MNEGLKASFQYSCRWILQHEIGIYSFVYGFTHSLLIIFKYFIFIITRSSPFKKLKKQRFCWYIGMWWVVDVCLVHGHLVLSVLIFLDESAVIVACQSWPEILLWAVQALQNLAQSWSTCVAVLPSRVLVVLLVLWFTLTIWLTYTAACQPDDPVSHGGCFPGSTVERLREWGQVPTSRVARSPVGKQRSFVMEAAVRWGQGGLFL